LLLSLRSFQDGKYIATTQPAFNIAAKYSLNKIFAVGLSGGYYRFSTKYEKTVASNDGKLPSDPWYVLSTNITGQYRKVFCIAGELTATYKRFKGRSLELYSTAAFGVTHTTGYDLHDGGSYFPNNPGTIILNCLWNPSTSVDQNELTAYISPIGIRGGNRLCWYGELGYGYKGMLNVGVGYKL
jgi:hypothetical protein